MIYKDQTKVKVAQKFQAGGAVASTEGAPAEAAPTQGQGQEDPIAQLVAMAQQALKSQDCQAAMAVCQGFMMLVSQSSQGGEQAPPAGEPVYKKGGTLLRRQ